MKRNATIKDIAEELGISATAVSRALRNMPDISGETREKVIAAAERLNYSKNYAASSLRTNSTNIIGLIIDILNPICIGMYKGVEDVCRENGYTILFSTSNEGRADERAAIETMYSRQVDGMILCPTLENRDNIDRMKELDIPFVLVGRTFPGDGIPSVVSSDLEGGYMIAQHLINRGKRCFLVMTALGYRGFCSALDRCLGFAKCLADNGFPEDCMEISECIPSRHHAYTAAAERFGRPFDFDAVFAFNDNMASGIIKALNDLRIAIPQKVAVVGYDNTESGEFTFPSLSTVDLLAYRQGREGMRLLLRLMKKENVPKEELNQVFHPELVIRQST